MTPDAIIIDFAKTLANVRKANTPKRGDAEAALVECLECGKRFVKAKGKRHTICPTCSRQRQIDAGQQLKDHEGPFYEKMVARNVAHWTKEARRLGIFVEIDDEE